MGWRRYIIQCKEEILWIYDVWAILKVYRLLGADELKVLRSAIAGAISHVTGYQRGRLV